MFNFVRKIKETLFWQPINTIPKDETEVLIWTETGIVTGWYYKGILRHDYFYGDEFDGPSLICYDDKFQIELEIFEKELYNNPNLFWRRIPPFWN